MNINSWSSDSIKTLLSSGSSSNSSNNMSSIYGNLSELKSIQSGSYGKLAKKYYASDSDSTTSKKDSVKKKDTKSEETKALSKIDESSEKLVEASKNLYKNNSLWKQADGEYDTDKIYSEVNSFVSAYNDALKNASSSEVDGIANAAASMVNTTTTNAKLLSKIGISIDSDTYKLSINESAFKSAKMSDAKALFSGNGSYAYQIGVAASKINYSAEQEASKSNTYTSSGSYQSGTKTGDMYDDLF